MTYVVAFGYVMNLMLKSQNTWKLFYKLNDKMTLVYLTGLIPYANYCMNKRLRNNRFVIIQQHMDQYNHLRLDLQVLR